MHQICGPSPAHGALHAVRLAVAPLLSETPTDATSYLNIAGGDVIAASWTPRAAIAQSTLDENECTTAPPKIREALNLHAGEVLDRYVMPDGVVLVRPKTKSIKDLVGLLRANAPNVAVDVDDMNPRGIVKETDIWHPAHNIASRPDGSCPVGLGALIKSR